MIYVPFRQSIDMYTGVTPPTISFLGTPSLSRLSSSFLTSSFGGKHTPEIFSSLLKPLLPTTSDDQQQQQQTQEEIKSSQSIHIPPMPSRKSSLSVIPEDKRIDAHGVPITRQCTFTQGVLNGMFLIYPHFLFCLLCCYHWVFLLLK
jgi:solute carrier family 32 (vesicular inhibitory amino acid transporter)